MLTDISSNLMDKPQCNSSTNQKNEIYMYNCSLELRRSVILLQKLVCFRTILTYRTIFFILEYDIYCLKLTEYTRFGSHEVGIAPFLLHQLLVLTSHLQIGPSVAYGSNIKDETQRTQDTVTSEKKYPIALEKYRSFRYLHDPFIPFFA